MPYYKIHSKVDINDAATDVVVGRNGATAVLWNESGIDCIIIYSSLSAAQRVHESEGDMVFEPAKMTRQDAARITDVLSTTEIDINNILTDLYSSILSKK